MRWECDLSSQTAASQAGLLMGDNIDVPAFRWYDKHSGRIVVSSSRDDCAEMERRLSSGNGLLADGGVSVGNLLSERCASPENETDTGEVAAFEELVGSHGGLGGPQAHPFAIVPSAWEAVEEPIVSAAAMHATLKRWIAAP